MTKINGRFIAILLIIATVSAMFSGCDLIFGQKPDGTVNYDEKWMPLRESGYLWTRRIHTSFLTVRRAL